MDDRLLNIQLDKSYREPLVRILSAVVVDLERRANAYYLQLERAGLASEEGELPPGSPAAKLYSDSMDVDWLLRLIRDAPEPVPKPFAPEADAFEAG